MKKAASKTKGLKPMKAYFRELIGEEEAEQFFSSLHFAKVGKDAKADGEEAETNTRVRSIRCNSLKVPMPELIQWLEAQGYSVKRSPYSQDTLLIDGHGEPLSLKLPYHAGFTYPQDEASAFAVELLDPQPGEYCIDLTAAPGGKSTHIAQRMKNTGVLLANDMDSKRLKSLHFNLERLGIFNTVVTRSTPFQLAAHYTEAFDRVLLDPSCSGEGLYVSAEGQPEHWRLKTIKGYAKMQFGLLCSAFRLLKPGGRLIYSTCTLNDLEDDGVAMRLLEKFPQAKLLDASELINKRPGGQEIQIPKQLAELNGVRFWPHITGTKGFFCIAITKTEPVPYNDEEKLRTAKLMSTRESRAVDERLEASYGIKRAELPFGETALLQKHDQIFLVSEALRDFPLHEKASLSLPLFHTHFDQYELSHAAALLLAPHVSDTSSDALVELDFESTQNFLSGEAELPLTEKLAAKLEEDGQYLATYKKFPLGRLRVQNGRMHLQLPRQH